MKITAITPIVARFGNRPRVLVKVETDEGITGWGETYSIGPDMAVGPTVDYCFELIKGIDPRRIEFIMMKLHQQFRFPPGGIGLSAISGIDHALWDIAGKLYDAPLYELLGGAWRKKIPCYASTYHGDENGGQPHQRVEGGYKLRQGCHLDLACDNGTRGAANDYA